MLARMATFALLACIATGQALATGVVQAKVTAVRVDSDGKGVVFFDQPIGGTPPNCVHAAYANALSFDSKTPGGRSILAVALAARATGDTVTAYGLGTCIVFGNAWVEDLNYAVAGF